MIIRNLLIISGTGNKSGKTTMACRIIQQFRNLNIISVKITPHFHETTSGLVLISEKPGYSICKETNECTSKDTSRMLKAGASAVFYIRVNDNSILDAFLEILEIIPEGTPVICESPALSRYAEPGLLVIMISSVNDNKKNIKSLIELPHIEFDLSYLSISEELPIIFSDGKWTSWHYGN